jgi:hypothetical protein
LNVTARASTDSFVLNGMPITEAIAPAAIHQLLGEPSRIHSAGPPAPHGHRNNQIHVYDTLGLYFNEHHHTRSLTGISFVFWPEAEGFPFTPAVAFSGKLQLGDYELPSGVFEKQVLTECGLPFREMLSGIWDLPGMIPMGLDTKGAKLKSGRRSSAKRLVSVSIGWPHDPRAQPLTNG